MNRDKERDIEEYLSTGELMALLGISRSTVYRLIADGMPYMKVRGVNRFAKDKVLVWLQGEDDSQKAQAILQQAQEILGKLKHTQKQTETTGQKR
jgi:excisionase family DNA binding protein